jgi:hypothetical protein
LKDVKTKPFLANVEKKSLKPDTELTQPVIIRVSQVANDQTAELPKGMVYYQPARMLYKFSGAQDLNSASSSQVALVVKIIVESEGPVHTDWVKTRIMETSGIRRIGNRIDMSIWNGIRHGVRVNYYLQRGNFLWAVPIKLPMIRAPKDGDERRSIELICPEEVALAADLCLRAALSLLPDDLIRETARLFKLQASDNNRDAIQQVLTRMEKYQMIELRGSKYCLVAKYQQTPLSIADIQDWT